VIKLDYLILGESSAPLQSNISRILQSGSTFNPSPNENSNYVFNIQADPANQANNQRMAGSGSEVGCIGIGVGCYCLFCVLIVSEYRFQQCVFSKCVRMTYVIFD